MPLAVMCLCLPFPVEHNYKALPESSRPKISKQQHDTWGFLEPPLHTAHTRLRGHTSANDHSSNASAQKAIAAAEQ